MAFSPGPRLFEQICLAFMVIDCAPGATAQVAQSLTTHPHMITIERAAADHDTLSIAATRDLPPSPATPSTCSRAFPASPRCRPASSRTCSPRAAGGVSPPWPPTSVPD
ncbi:hypothetical protein ACFQ51_00550 [Streptomyces kaempferi]